MEHRSQEEDRDRQREQERSHPRLPSGPSNPEAPRRHSQEYHRRLSQEFRSRTKSPSHESLMSQGDVAGPLHRPLQRRGSHASLRSFDDDHSSRPSSIGSQADCQYFSITFFSYLTSCQIVIEFRNSNEKETTSESENGISDIHPPGHPRV